MPINKLHNWPIVNAAFLFLVVHEMKPHSQSVSHDLVSARSVLSCAVSNA